MSDGQQLESALDLMRRMPPTHIEKYLGQIIDLVPDLAEDVLQAVDQPLKIQKDSSANGREYLICDYNRDGDSYRSPWSNKYDPPLTDGSVPSDRLREIEVMANSAFDAFRDMYYMGGYSSVYFWDLDDGFASCWLIKKASDPTIKSGFSSWDSTHVVEVILDESAKTAKYKLTTTIMLALTTQSEAVGATTLCGNLAKQTEKDAPFTDAASHICTIGQMIEAMENTVRESLYEVYFSKTQEVSNSIRSLRGMAEENQKRENQRKIREQMDGASGKEMRHDQRNVEVK